MADDLPDGLVWDLDRNEANQKKHGISFAQACELFYSEADYVQIVDDARCQVEPRFIVIGPIRRGLVLVACTVRDEDTIRIISARWATPSERELFRRHMEQQW